MGKAEQERPSSPSRTLGPDEILSASYSQMRRAERAPRELVYRSEMLKWRMRALLGHGGHAPGWAALGGGEKPFQRRGSRVLCRPLPFSLPFIYPSAWKVNSRKSPQSSTDS